MSLSVLFISIASEVSVKQLVMYHVAVRLTSVGHVLDAFLGNVLEHLPCGINGFN